MHVFSELFRCVHLNEHPTLLTEDTRTRTYNMHTREDKSSHSGISEPKITHRKRSSLLSLHAQEKALATPRRPCSPEGRCARGRPQHVSAASYGRPEHILPGHLGPVGAQRGGRRHAASIWGSRRPSSTHGRVAPRPTIWRRTDAPRPRIRTRLRRAAGHRPAPHRATAALQHEARSRHNIDPGTREPSPRRRRRVGTRNFPNFFPNL